MAAEGQTQRLAQVLEKMPAVGDLRFIGSTATGAISDAAGSTAAGGTARFCRLRPGYKPPCRPVEEFGMVHGRIIGVDCDSDSMDSFAPPVNPGTCTKYAEDPRIVAPHVSANPRRRSLVSLFRPALKVKHRTPRYPVTIPRKPWGRVPAGAGSETEVVRAILDALCRGSIDVGWTALVPPILSLSVSRKLARVVLRSGKCNARETRRSKWT